MSSNANLYLLFDNLNEYIIDVYLYKGLINYSKLNQN